MSTVNWSLQHKRDTAANWAANNTVLLAGQLGIETDGLTTTPKFKIGDGTTAYNTLPYFYGGSASAQDLQNVLTVGNSSGNLSAKFGTGTIYFGATNQVHVQYVSGIELHNTTANTLVNLGDTGRWKVDAIQYMPNLSASSILSLDANKEMVTVHNTTGSGTTLVLSTSPTFTTDITTPLIIGGSAVGSNITYKSTSGTGTLTGSAHVFKGGNNGGTTLSQYLNNGQYLGYSTISAVSGLTVGNNLTTYVNNDGVGGLQSGGLFSAIYTVSGQSTVTEISSIYTAFYHSNGFTVPTAKGIETGIMYVSGASSVITSAWGVDAHLPICSTGGAVTTAAAIHVSSQATTGITTPYAIYSEQTAASLFMGGIYFNATTGTNSGYIRYSSNTTILKGGTSGYQFRNSADANKLTLDDSGNAVFSGSVSCSGGIVNSSGNSSFAGFVTVNGRLRGKQGVDVASANNLALGSDGNVFEITGTTQINLISNLTWQNGCFITLLFTSTPTVKHNQATSGTDITIQLAGAVDFVATAGDTLTLCLCEIGGTQAWREISRSVI